MPPLPAAFTRLLAGTTLPLDDFSAQPLQALPRPSLQIKALLLSVKPGDLLFVDHPGPPGNDGGHTRICTRPAQRTDPDAAPEFAQARYEQARLQRDGLGALAAGRELQFWHLRSSIRQGPTL